MGLPKGLKTNATTADGIANLRGKQEPRPLYDGLRITLPLPNKELSPNARCHWAVKAKYTKAYRQIAAMLGKQAIANGYDRHFVMMIGGHATGRLHQFTTQTPSFNIAVVRCVFLFRDKRKRDRDNLLASLKSAFDGLADAGIVENDCAFSYAPVEVLCDKDNPRVEIYVQEVT